MTEQTGEYVIAKSGAIRDPVSGRIVANPGGGTTAITPANASEYHQLYARKRLEAELAASRGLARVAVSGPSEFDAWADIAANMGGLALHSDPKYGRVSVERSRVVGRMSSLITRPRSNTCELPANTLQIT